MDRSSNSQPIGKLFERMRNELAVGQEPFVWRYVTNDKEQDAARHAEFTMEMLLKYGCGSAKKSGEGTSGQMSRHQCGLDESLRPNSTVIQPFQATVHEETIASLNRQKKKIRIENKSAPVPEVTEETDNVEEDQIGDEIVVDVVNPNGTEKSGEINVQNEQNGQIVSDPMPTDQDAHIQEYNDSLQDEQRPLDLDEITTTAADSVTSQIVPSPSPSLAPIAAGRTISSPPVHDVSQKSPSMDASAVFPANPTTSTMNQNGSKRMSIGRTKSPKEKKRDKVNKGKNKQLNKKALEIGRAVLSGSISVISNKTMSPVPSDSDRSVFNGNFSAPQSPRMIQATTSSQLYRVPVNVPRSGPQTVQLQFCETDLLEGSNNSHMEE